MIKYQFKVFSVFFWLFIFHCKYIEAQEQTYHFEHLTTQNGLTSSRILNIFQDSKGYMWFGTYDGLNRYDGYKIEGFVHSKDDSNSISNNYINAIAEDASGNIWIGTNAGLNKYSYKTGRFKKIDLEKGKEISHYNRISYINCLLIKDDYLWVGTYGGLFKIDPLKSNPDGTAVKAGKYFHYDPANPESGYHVVWNLKVDRNGVIWATNHLSSLYRYNSQKKRFIEYPVSLKGVDIEQNTSITITYIDEKNNFWLKNLNYGFIHWNRKTNIFSGNAPFFSNYQLNIKNKINSVLEENDSILWIGTDGKGLFLYNKNSGTLQRKSLHPADPHSLSSDKLTVLYKNKKGLILIGTINNGINIYNPRKSEFSHFYAIACQSNSLNNNNVICFEEDRNGHIWIGTDKGISVFNPDNNKFTQNTRISDDFSKLEQETIINIMEDNQGQVWISTYLQGLFIYQPETKKLSPFSCEMLGFDYTGDVIKTWHNIQDDNGNIWLSVPNTGLVLFNNDRNQCYLYTSDTQNEHTLSHGGIRDIVVDADNKLWLATYHGLNCADLNSVNFNNPHPKIQFKRHLFVKDSNTLNDNRIEVLTEASTGEMLIGSESGGLNIYNPSAQSFSYINKNNGLPANYITGILEDNNQNIWVTTRKGVTKINSDRKHTYTYKYTDGLQSNEFNCAFKSTNGRFYLGGNNGFNTFFPENITVDSSDVKIYITGLKIFNKTIEPGDTINSRQILRQKIMFAEKLELTYRENSFTFKFLAIDYFNPSKIQYKYRMKGFDNRWIMAGNTRVASYTNLSPGTYVFQVFSTNSHGIWCSKGKSLQLVILPPWWKTKTAYIIYSIGIALIFIMVRYFTNKELKIRNKLKMERINREQESKMHQMKMRFFTNISHEFRTPLTLISGPFQSLYKIGKQKKWSSDILQQIEIIQRNIKRLTTLTNQLLDIRKLESGQMKLNLSFGNLASYISSIAESFYELAKQKNIEFSWQINPSTFETWFDPDKIEKLVNNLLSNAFKFTPSQGKVTLLLNIRKEQQTVEMVVTDTGKGIEKNNLHNIFNRFYQIDNEKNIQDYGTGIGLSLVKDLVDLHKGQINVESALGEGTIFKIMLPLIETCDDKSKEKGITTIPNNKEALKDYNLNSLPAQNKTTAKSKTSILIVEDNADMRIFIRNILISEHKILEAENGSEGLDMAFDKMPSLIISDVMMPQMDGVEFCKKLKSDVRTSHIPIIILTALTSIDHKIKGLETGADDYITKPFHEEILLLKIKNLLHSRILLRNFFIKQADLIPSGKSDKTVIEPSQIEINDIDKEFIQQITTIVEQNISNASFSVNQLANAVNIGNTQLFLKMKALLNVSPGSFIHQMRLKRAAQLLDDSKYNIKEICYMVGFSDPKYFSKCFKKYFGVTPSKFKNE